MGDTTIQFKKSDGEVLKECASLPYIPQVGHGVNIDALPYRVYRVDHEYSKCDIIDITIWCDRL